MSTRENEFETPLPGNEIVGPGRENLLRRFESVFGVERSGTLPFNIPTACLIEGMSVPRFWDTDDFHSRGPVYFLLENFPPILMACTAHEARSYFESKEPWEDYDICIFDDTMSFCYAASHEDRFILSQAPPKF